jgi:hypothetical protein
VRRSRQEREKLTDFAVRQGNYKLRDLTRLYEEISAMPDSPDRMFAVPMSAPAKIEHRGLPLDLMEDLLASSPAWLQAQRVTHAPKAQVSGRPLIPSIGAMWVCFVRVRSSTVASAKEGTFICPFGSR